MSGGLDVDVWVEVMEGREEEREEGEERRWRLRGRLGERDLPAAWKEEVEGAD